MRGDRDTYYKQWALHYKNRAKMNRCTAAVHLEATVDKDFWSKVFREFLPDDSFDYITYTRIPDRTNATGCQTCLKYHRLGCLSKDFIICIDSDYRWLLQEREMDIEHFIFQTYTYSWENHYCYPKNIENTFGKSGFPDNSFNFESFLQKYSETLYELFLYHLISIINKDHVFDADDFNPFIDIGDVLHFNEEKLISSLQSRFENKLNELKNYYSSTEIEQMKSRCYSLGLSKDNAYFYFRGHNMFDRVVVRMIKGIIKKLESNQSKPYTSEEKRDYFFREKRTVEECLTEDIHFDMYSEINKIKVDTEKYKQFYS
jgi:hypothetical protein